MAKSNLDLALEASEDEVPVSNLDLALQQAEKDESLFDGLKEIVTFFEPEFTGAAKGLARILGMPADLFNFFAEAEIPGTSLPINPPARLIKRGIEATGLTVPGSQDFVDFLGESTGLDVAPQNFNTRLRQNVAEEVGTGFVAGLGLIKAGKGATKLPGVIRNLAEHAANNPFKFVAGETVISTAVGVTRTALEEKDVGPAGQFAGEIGTSLVAGGLLSLGRGIARGVTDSPKLKDTIPLGDREFTTTRTDVDKAAEVLQDSVVDLDSAIARLEAGEHVDGMTPAAITGDPGIISLEKGAAVTDIGSRLKSQADDTAQANLRANFDDAAGGNRLDAKGKETVSKPEDAKRLFETRVEQANTAIKKGVDRATSNVTKQIEGLPKGGALRKEHLSELAKKELDTVVANWRVDESKAWARVADKVQVDMRVLRKHWDDIKTGKTKTEKALNKSSIPKDIDHLIGEIDLPKKGRQKGQYADHESLEELLSLRSLVLDRLRKARGSATPDAREISMLSDLQEFTMNFIEGTGDFAEGVLKGQDLLNLQSARAITKQGHDKFFRSQIGKFLQMNTKGGVKFEEKQFLEELLAQGTKGGINADSLFKALPTEEATNRANEFLQIQFGEMVANGEGNLNIVNAQRFRRNFDSILSRPEFKKTKDYVDRLITSGQKSDRAIKIGDSGKKAIKDRAAAHLFVGKSPHQALRTLFNLEDPAKGMEELIRLTKSDPSGSALAGLKRSMLDEIVPNGDFTPRRIGNFMKAHEKMLKQLYSPDEMKRLNGVVNKLEQIEIVNRTGLKGSRTIENASMLASFIGRVGGASVMRAFGFGTIQATGAGANVGRRIASRLSTEQVATIIEEAIFDPDLYKTLLLRPTKKNTKFILKRLRGHLFNIGITLDETEEDVIVQ